MTAQDTVSRAEFDAVLRQLAEIDARDRQRDELIEARVEVVEARVVGLEGRIDQHIDVDRRLDELEKALADALERVAYVEALEARVVQLEARVDLLERGGRRVTD